MFRKVSAILDTRIAGSLRSSADYTQMILRHAEGLLKERRRFPRRKYRQTSSCWRKVHKCVLLAVSHELTIGERKTPVKDFSTRGFACFSAHAVYVCIVSIFISARMSVGDFSQRSTRLCLLAVVRLGLGGTSKQAWPFSTNSVCQGQEEDKKCRVYFRGTVCLRCY